MVHVQQELMLQIIEIVSDKILHNRVVSTPANHILWLFSLKIWSFGIETKSTYAQGNENLNQNIESIEIILVLIK